MESLVAEEWKVDARVGKANDANLAFVAEPLGQLQVDIHWRLRLRHQSALRRGC